MAIFSAFADFFGTSSQAPSSEGLLKLLRKTIPHDRWFIAGSYAVMPRVASDIDIYFLDETSYDAAVTAFASTSHGGATPNTTTFYIFPHTYQLVHCTYGTPYEVLSTFDLACCQRALLPDGSAYTHPNYRLEVALTSSSNIRSNLFSRICKYLNRDLPLNTASFVTIFDEVLASPAFTVPSPYDAESGKCPTSHELVTNIITSIPDFRPHYEQHYPELFV